MSVASRLVAFVVVLVLALGAGWALGNAVGPFDDAADQIPSHAPAQAGTTGADRTIGTVSEVHADEHES